MCACTDPSVSDLATRVPVIVRKQKLTLLPILPVHPASTNPPAFAPKAHFCPEGPVVSASTMEYVEPMWTQENHTLGADATVNGPDLIVNYL